MNYFKKLKTSEKISLSFSLLGFFSLLLFLVLINITYFFIWYADQKEMAFNTMETNYYETIERQEQITDIQHFQNYILTKDTIIIPDAGDMICSPGVTKKIHADVELIKDKYFYNDTGTTYFIYSKYFEGIGEVKMLFDTTSYIKSQIIIIKIGLIFMILVFLIQYIIGKIISRRLLKDLIVISERAKNFDINTHYRHITCNMPKNDEIRILAQALNSSYDAVQTETHKLKQFLTDVSHEFKTPLMGMSSELDVLEKKQEKKLLKDADVETLFKNSRRNILKLNTLLETLFLLTRIEEKKENFTKENINLAAYIEKKIQDMKQVFPHKNINVSIDIDAKLVWKVEKNLFSILVDNLLSNAIKFSPEKTKLHIHADAKHFSVQDNGVGISKEEQKSIWNKFYRKDTNKEGFGVGLYLVKRIIDICNWKISVESKQDSGTKFIIHL